MTRDEALALDEARHELQAWAAKHAATLTYLDTTYGYQSKSKPLQGSVVMLVEAIADIWLDPEQLEDIAITRMKDHQMAKRERAHRRAQEKAEKDAFEAKMEAIHPGYIERMRTSERERRAERRRQRAQQ